MNRIEIDTNTWKTDVVFNGVPLDHITRIDASFSVNELPAVTIYFNGGAGEKHTGLDRASGNGEMEQDVTAFVHKRIGDTTDGKND